ncbi:Protein of unknown function [Pyronema omphalodes CBS 100304]|uniref:Uncharacterized protein n=1 Tax=Pyronema omphalodes (strain CBS 100304) TaxID=1076935 RepID=U4L619_PYROM|nr:Protein of unknown function [Pyronema omphalodes CBS 100304]
MHIQEKHCASQNLVHLLFSGSWSLRTNRTQNSRSIS